MTQPIAGLTSVIIVSYRSLATLSSCLDAVLASDTPVEVVVVDNDSEDGSVRWLLDRAATESRLKVIANTRNRGFAAACNQGAATASGDALMLLNPDAYLPVDALRRLRAYFARDAGIGLLGCAIVDGQGNLHGPQRRREPTARRALMTLSGLDRWQRRWPCLAGIERPPSTAPEMPGSAPESVDAVNGSVMLIRTTVYRDLHGMDEGFTLHAEDLDLCRRIRDAGWQVRRAGDVRVVHVGGVSSRSRPIWVEWQKTRSLWRYFRKHQSKAGWPQRAVIAAALAVRFTLKLPLLVLKRLLAHCARPGRGD